MRMTASSNSKDASATRSSAGAAVLEALRRLVEAPFSAASRRSAATLGGSRTRRISGLAPSGWHTSGCR
jgi:hypothetical protein